MKENPAATTGTVCHSEVFTFPAVKKRAVQASFTGGAVTSDGGIPLLRQTDRRIGLTKALAQPLIEQSEQAFLQTREQQRRLGEVHYAADTWDRARRVLVKAEPTDPGSNPRLVVTNLAGAAQALYDEVYCARGEMENRIKEPLWGLFADRTHCGGGWANQFRRLLSRCGYVLLERLRALGLAGTEQARAQAGTIRLKRLKMGAVVLRNTRRVKLRLSSACPYPKIFGQGFRALGSG